MWMKRCVSTQTWQPVTANLTLPFGTVSWLHFSSKPLPGSAFTSFLQLFFVARSPMIAPSWWWHRKEAFLQASLHVYDLTMASFCMELFTEVVSWHNLAFPSYWFLILWNNDPDYPLFCANGCYRVKNLIRIKCVCASLSPYYQHTISCGWTAKNCPFRIWVIFYRGVNAEIERRGWATDLEAPYMYQEELH